MALPSRNTSQAYLEQLKQQAMRQAYDAQVNGPGPIQGNTAGAASMPTAPIAQGVPRAPIPGGPIGYLSARDQAVQNSPTSQMAGDQVLQVPADKGNYAGYLSLLNANSPMQTGANGAPMTYGSGQLDPRRITNYADSVQRGQDLLAYANQVTRRTPDQRYLNPQTDQIQKSAGRYGLGTPEQGLLAMGTGDQAQQQTQQAPVQSQGLNSPDFMSKISTIYASLPEDKRSIFDDVFNQVQTHLGMSSNQPTDGGYLG